MQEVDIIKYYTEEWGKLTEDDTRLFEYLILETAQAGLSWNTVLKRRENYRKAFANYDINKIITFSQKDIEELMRNSGIIRNRKKIEATINNAKEFLKIQKEFGTFANYIKTFLPNGKPPKNTYKTLADVPAKNEISDKISKDMKKRGFKFFGSVMCYSFLQSSGYISDDILEIKELYKDPYKNL